MVMYIQRFWRLYWQRMGRKKVAALAKITRWVRKHIGSFRVKRKERAIHKVKTYITEMKEVSSFCVLVFDAMSLSLSKRGTQRQRERDGFSGFSMLHLHVLSSDAFRLQVILVLPAIRKFKQRVLVIQRSVRQHIERSRLIRKRLQTHFEKMEKQIIFNLVRLFARLLPRTPR